ncbi:purple acid phosphatase 15-like isoform X1 [Vitis riparia]|uniref:purple acid phosphatase 15-like isoform X1 n=1 Tax=Vitis riparia TaxID=96939 RepID=UPI00155ACC83|nr:purple acid phosphatase 15-like isoform X1 [Vitis riparia]
MGVASVSAISLAVLAAFSFLCVDGDGIPTTLDGPFKPLTVPLDTSFRGNAVDLPHTDPRLQRTVQGFEPEQISVTLSATYDSVWISWVTGEFQIGDNIKPLDPKSVASQVFYGKKKHRLVHMSNGHSLVYNQLYPFEGLQNYTSGIIHHVRLTGLKPDTVYYYQCGDASIPALSDIHYFKTMAASGPRSYPNRIAVVGDLGLTYNTTSTISHLMSNDPDLIVFVGDVCYANMYLTNGTGSDCYSCSFSQTPIHETYQPRWDYWGRFMQPLISKIPIMAVEGNHEIEEQAENQTFVAYSSRFAFPSKESGSSSTFYYSFNAGGIHVIMLGAYISYDKSEEQYKWLERDLKKVDRKVTPWLVATWHPPWYSTYKAHYREAECMRVAMEDLLYNYGVDIIFSGHVHAYERSNRVYNYTLDPCGPVYITVGDGGNREKMAIPHADEPGQCPEPSTTPDKYMGGFCAFNFTSGPAAGRFCWDRQPDYSAYRETSFGHGILEMKNETVALWTWHRNQDFYNLAGDQIYIVRQPDRCPVETKVI